MTTERELYKREFTCDQTAAGRIPVSEDGVALFPGTTFYCLSPAEDGVRITVVKIVGLSLAGEITVVHAESAVYSGPPGSNKIPVDPKRLYFNREKASIQLLQHVPQLNVGDVASFSHWKQQSTKGRA